MSADKQEFKWNDLFGNCTIFHMGKNLVVLNKQENDDEDEDQARQEGRDHQQVANISRPIFMRLESEKGKGTKETNQKQGSHMAHTLTSKN